VGDLSKGTVGMPFPGVETKIMHANNDGAFRPVTIDETPGELWVKTPGMFSEHFCYSDIS
jgi:long-subunit acyl-CoA synthetase (AMP-forming)